MKRCPDCKEVKSLEDFPRHRSMRDGHGTYCKSCHNARTRASVARRGGARVYHLRRRYNITEAVFAQLVEQQGGRCAICGGPEPTHLDHDHRVGFVRGLLCVACNNGLGLFRDNPDRLEAAARYLRKATPSKAGGE